ncbi:MAG TPA: O-antigen ligase family protein [Kineosporiaceae bacterium]|nr:O-antigen ligase family protein [Kineosporiaceae bacterium]
MRNRRNRRDPAGWLVLTSWAVVVLPRLVQTFTVTKYRATVGAGVPESPWSVQAERGLEVVLILLCTGIVARRARSLPTRGGLRLAVLLAPWGFMILRDLSQGTGPKIASVVYPFVVVAVWALQPRLTALRPLGVLVGLTAALSLALGVLTPERAIFTSFTGDQISPTKQLLPWGVLIGPFSDPNNLAQFLVLGLPAVSLLRGWLQRAGFAVLTVCAIVWTSSRSSLGAVAAAALVSLLLVPLRPVTRRLVARAVALVLATALVAVPLTTQDDSAFTNRGFIWRQGLRTWGEAPWLGHGSNWYAEAGRYVNSLGQLAFHGHNQFVHTLVTGGLVYLALMVLLILVLVSAAGTWAEQGNGYPAVYLAGFLVSCTLEVSFGVVDRSFLLAVTVVPMAFFAFAVPGVPATPAGAGVTR